MRRDIFFFAGGAVITALAVKYADTPWLWDGTLYVGVAVMGVALLDFLIREVWLKKTEKRMWAIGMGVFGGAFLVCAAGYFWPISINKQVANVPAVPSDKPKRLLKVACTSFVTRPTKGFENRILYITEFIDANSSVDSLNYANTHFGPGMGDIKWDDSAFPTSFARCEIVNFSTTNLLRVSFDYVVDYMEVIKTDNGTKSGGVVKRIKATSPQFDLGPATRADDYFFIANLSSYYLGIRVPDTARAYTVDSDAAIETKLIPVEWQQAFASLPPHSATGVSVITHEAK